MVHSTTLYTDVEYVLAYSFRSVDRVSHREMPWIFISRNLFPLSKIIIDVAMNTCLMMLTHICHESLCSCLRGSTECIESCKINQYYCQYCEMRICLLNKHMYSTTIYHILFLYLSHTLFHLFLSLDRTHFDFYCLYLEPIRRLYWVGSIFIKLIFITIYSKHICASIKFISMLRSRSQNSICYLISGSNSMRQKRMRCACASMGFAQGLVFAIYLNLHVKLK